MSKKMRLIALFVCIATLSTMLAACAPKNTTGDADQGKDVTITIGCWPIKESQPETFALYEGYKKAFEAKYPNIHIKTDEWAFTTDTYMPLAAAGTLPNMYRVPYTEPRKIIESGYALDITKYVQENGYTTGVQKDALALVTKDGKYYGIPYSGYMFGMQYNIDMFRKAGLVNPDGTVKYPKTYQELAETAKIIKDKTGKAGFGIATKGGWGGWQFMEIAWSFGVNFMQQKGDKWVATFNSPEAIAAFQYLYDLRWKYDVLPKNVLLERDDVMQLQGTSQCAIAFGGDGCVEPKQLAYGTKLEDYGWGPVPAGPKGHYSQFGGDVYMFSKETNDAQLAACMKWANFIGNGVKADDNFKSAFTKQVQAWSKEGYGIRKPSFRIWMSPEKLKFQDELYDKYTNVNKKQNTNLLSDGVQLRPEEPMYAQQLYNLLSNVMQEILNNKNADIPKLVKDANAKFQSDFLDKGSL